jgi:hypothetical protein
VKSHFPGETESNTTEIFLSIDGNIQSCLLLVVILKMPDWSWAMNGIDEVWITVLSEGICNKLSFLSLALIFS